LSSWLGGTAGTQPKCGNGGVSDAVTSELGDRQSSHPVKNPASILWQVFRGVAMCCLPRFRDNRSTLNTKTGYKKNSRQVGSIISTLARVTSQMYSKYAISLY